MSVIIYGVDAESDGFPGLAVSSEENYYNLWLPLIQKLNLKYIGDQRWLYKKDIHMILSEFQKLYDYSKQHTEFKSIADHSLHILENLEDLWNETAPKAERLWMG